jgi:ParB-like chromosome segregation protein Spo0J
MKKSKPIDWKNRIIEHGEMPAARYNAHELNARRHPDHQREALVGSLNEVGWVAPVIVSARTGKLLDGHARVEEAMARDRNALVPFVRVDVSEAEEKLILATFDPITNQALYDKDALDALLRDIQTSETGLLSLLADLAAQNDLSLADDEPEPSGGGDDFEASSGRGADTRPVR